MSGELQAQASTTVSPPSLSQARSGLLQRKCACGGSPGVSGECSECQEKHLSLQRYPSDRAASSILDSTTLRRAAGGTVPIGGPGYATAYSFDRARVNSRALRSAQAKLAVSESGGLYEQEADRAGEHVRASFGLAAGGPSLAPLSGVSPPMQSIPAAEEPVNGAPAERETAPRHEAAPAVLIAEDEASETVPGQMKKSEFLDQLQSAVCSAADAELAAVGRTAQGCPYIERWIGYYRTRSSSHLERALRRYAPEASGVTSAAGYIPLVAARVRSAVSVWATTGLLTGVPEELASQLGSNDIAGTVEGFLSSASGGVTEAVGEAGQAIGGIFTKAREGGAREADDPQRIQSQLNAGQSLDSGVRSKMEGAFGHDFSRVRVHTGSRAAGLSSGLNARAFTIGSDIAFGAGEYRPGTLVGDALLAHELAHVVQQAGGSSSAGPRQKGVGDYDALEEDADRSAVGAVVSMWTGAKDSLSGIGKEAMPRLKTGLRLSRCKGGEAAANKNIDGIDLGPTDAAKKFCRKGAFNETYTVGSNTTTAATANSVIAFEGENTGTKDGKTCSCDCGFLRQYIKGYWIRGTGGSKKYTVKSCGNTITMNETTWVEEHMACDPQADKCKQNYTDNPGWSSGLSEGDYIELVYEFKFELWDHCQGVAETTTYKKATLKGDKAPRTITWT